MGNSKSSNQEPEWEIVTRKQRYPIFIHVEKMTQDTFFQKRKWIRDRFGPDPNFLNVINPTQKTENNFRLEFTNVKSRNDAINSLKDDNITATTSIEFEQTKTTELPQTRTGITILDIPTNINENAVKNVCEQIGTVKTFKCKQKGGWKSAQVTFEESDESLKLEQI